jgi:hypothetical protein
VGQSFAGASLYKIAAEQSAQIYRHGLQEEDGWVVGLIYSTVRRIRILPSTATSSLSFMRDFELAGSNFACKIHLSKILLDNKTKT